MANDLVQVQIETLEGVQRELGEALDASTETLHDLRAVAALDGIPAQWARPIARTPILTGRNVTRLGKIVLELTEAQVRAARLLAVARSVAQTEPAAE